MNLINTNLSYFRLRKIIGFLGMLLPILTPIIAGEELSSISHSYYTEAGVLFTSVLTLCGIFLCSYRGYDRDEDRISDNIITWIAGIAVIIVAAVPTIFSDNADLCKSGFPTPVGHCDPFWGGIHFGSAALFFALMAVLFIRRFTRGDQNQTGKSTRNLIYKICGWAILATLVYAGVRIFIIKGVAEDFVFWIEVVLLAFFAAAWMVKGKALADLGIQVEDNQEKFRQEVEQISGKVYEQIISNEDKDLFNQLKKIHQEISENPEG